MNIEKLEKEKSRIEKIGVESYMKERKVKIGLLWFLISIGIAFVLGAIIF